MWEVIKFDNKNKQIFIDKEKEINIIAPMHIGNKRYKIESILSNSGGFGVIYNAIDTKLRNRKVLIKALKYKPSIFKDSHNNLDELKEKILNIRQTAKNEYKTLVYLKKGKEARMPSIIDVIYDESPQLIACSNISKDISNSEPYIIMQKVPGVTFNDMIKDGDIDTLIKTKGYNSRRDWELEAMSYGYQIATILGNFHKREIYEGKQSYFVYQDLKPDNIILSYDRTITLLDFGGMVRVKEVIIDGEINTVTNDELGNPGVGTVGYQAQEVEKNCYTIDERADIFSLGAILFYLLTGTKPSKIITKVDERLPVEVLKNNYNNATYEIIKKCTEIDREDRYKNMEELKLKIRDSFKEIKNSN